MKTEKQWEGAVEARRKKAADPKTKKERFMAMVQKAENGCWIWGGGRNGASGYGLFWLAGSSIGAHRAAVQLFQGVILKKGDVVMHNCPSGDDRACVNPDHLIVGTHKLNMQDMINKGQSRRGARSKCAKLTELQVRQIKGEYVHRDGELTRLANKFGVGATTIHAIVKGVNWGHVDVNIGSDSDPTLVNHRSSAGEGHHNAKLIAADVLDIRAAVKAGVSLDVIVENYGIQKAQASAIATGQAWKHLGGESRLL